MTAPLAGSELNDCNCKFQEKKLCDKSCEPRHQPKMGQKMGHSGYPGSKSPILTSFVTHNYLGFGVLWVSGGSQDY
eukprot:2532762-Amphidinium_carterae.1